MSFFVEPVFPQEPQLFLDRPVGCAEKDRVLVRFELVAVPAGDNNQILRSPLEHLLIRDDPAMPLDGAEQQSFGGARLGSAEPFWQILQKGANGRCGMIAVGRIYILQANALTGIDRPGSRKRYKSGAAFFIRLVEHWRRGPRMYVSHRQHVGAKPRG